MNMFKLPFNNDLKIILFKLKVNKNYSDLIQKYSTLLKPIKIYENLHDNQLELLTFRDTNFENSKLLEFLEYLIKNNLYDFKVYLFYFENNLFYPSINVSKVFTKKEKLNTTTKKYNSLFYFFNKKKLNKVFWKAMNNNILTKNENKGNKKYIKILNFQKCNIQLSKILNLFSVFGTINIIYYNYYDGSIFIDYNEYYEVKRVLNNNKIWKYNGIKINILISSLNLKNYTYFKYIKPIKIENKINRFNNKIKIKYNAPSKILNFININFGLKLFKLYKLIQVYVEPSLIKFNFIKNGNTKMCLIRFKRIEDSINVLVNLNNKIIEKRKLKISFSFNKFII